MNYFKQTKVRMSVWEPVIQAACPSRPAPGPGPCPPWRLAPPCAVMAPSALALSSLPSVPRSSGVRAALHHASSLPKPPAGENCPLALASAASQPCCEHPCPPPQGPCEVSGAGEAARGGHAPHSSFMCQEAGSGWGEGGMRGQGTSGREG